MTKKGIFQVIVIVLVIIVASFSMSFAATSSHKELIENRKVLLQQVISRINDLIAERERLTGQLILLQQLDAQAIAEREAEAEKAIIEAEEKTKEEFGLDTGSEGGSTFSAAVIASEEEEQAEAFEKAKEFLNQLPETIE